MRDPLPRVQRGLAAALRDRRTQLSAAAFVLTALACYLYVLVGNINNYDNIVCTPEGYGTGLRSGRWMLTLLGDTVGHAMGNFNLPLFNGLLGLVFLGLACQFLWRALHLQKPWQCAVLTAITAAWPAAASAMLFSFTVHYYLFAVLLAAVAVWMTDRSGWGWFVGAVLTLACSIGVYQAYFPLAAALLVLRLLQQCLDSETPWKTVALRALRFVGVLAAAMVVYFLLLHLCLRLYHETLTAYRGINNMGKLNFAELPQMLVRCVRCFYLLPKTGYAFLTNSRLIRWAMWASLLLSAVSLALAWRDRDWKKIVTVVLLLAALPIAANGIFIMAPETATHTLMTYGVVTLFYLPLIVGDGLRWRRDAVRRWVSLLTCLCLAGASAGYAWFCNGCYRTNYYSNEIMASYYTSMLTRALDGGLHARSRDRICRPICGGSDAVRPVERHAVHHGRPQHSLRPDQRIRPPAHDRDVHRHGNALRHRRRAGAVRRQHCRCPELPRRRLHVDRGRQAVHPSLRPEHGILLTDCQKSSGGLF